MERSGSWQRTAKSNISAWLREERTMRGWSLPKMAEHLIVPERNLTQWEHAQRLLTIDELMRLCSILGSSPHPFTWIGGEPESMGGGPSHDDRRMSSESLPPEGRQRGRAG